MPPKASKFGPGADIATATGSNDCPPFALTCACYKWMYVSVLHQPDRNQAVFRQLQPPSIRSAALLRARRYGAFAPLD